MSPTPRLPDLQLADSGRTFVMRPGSERVLQVGEAGTPPTVHGEDGVVRVQGESGRARPHEVRYLVTAVGRGRATIRSGAAEWHVEVRGAPPPPEQTRDDTDSGWGESGPADSAESGMPESGISQRWWEDQRPPHW